MLLQEYPVAPATLREPEGISIFPPRVRYIEYSEMIRIGNGALNVELVTALQVQTRVVSVKSGDLGLVKAFWLVFKYTWAI